MFNITEHQGNEKQTTVRHHLVLIRMTSTKTEITSVAEDVQKIGYLCTSNGNVNWFSHYGKQHRDSNIKLKI